MQTNECTTRTSCREKEKKWRTDKRQSHIDNIQRRTRQYKQARENISTRADPATPYTSYGVHTLSVIQNIIPGQSGRKTWQELVHDRTYQSRINKLSVEYTRPQFPSMTGIISTYDMNLIHQLNDSRYRGCSGRFLDRPQPMYAGYLFRETAYCKYPTSGLVKFAVLKSSAGLETCTVEVKVHGWERLSYSQQAPDASVVARIERPSASV